MIAPAKFGDRRRGERVADENIDAGTVAAATSAKQRTDFIVVTLSNRR
jgi:hypothetical protein